MTKTAQQKKDIRMQDIAKKMEEQFEYQQRDDGEGFYSFKLDAIKENNTYHQILSHIIQEASTGQDYAYKWAHNACEAFMDVEDLEEADIYELTDGEIDVYTYKLCTWLQADAYNMELLTDAIAEGTRDGIQAIQRAQGMAIDSIYNAVRDAIVKLYKLEYTK